LSQWSDAVELVVVDGASPDATPAIMADYCARHPHIVYRREAMNSGVDADYDKAVGYARGQYCWLMSDDDLVAPGAIARLLPRLDGDRDLVILNTEVRSRNLQRVLRPRRLDVRQDRVYGADAQQELFLDLAEHLSFIPAVVVARSVWREYDRQAYFGSLFIHIGVLFGRPRQVRALLIADPMLVMRDGNAMWSPKAFWVWTQQWPRLIWSFEHFPASTRAAVTVREPARNGKTLLWFRALGAYGMPEWQASDARDAAGWASAVPRLIAKLPANLANAGVAAYCALNLDGHARMKLYTLARVATASMLAKMLAWAWRANDA
jgi:abequosyltransferase